MAYEEIGEIQTVVLGGVDKKSRKTNPTELEGHFVAVEQRPNKFNPQKPQNYYIFQTPVGLRGVFGKAGIDRVMKGALLGAMIKLVSTGELLDTGKGNPMKVFKAYQDKNNRIDASEVSYNLPTTTEEEGDTGPTQYAQGAYTEVDENEVDHDDTPVDEPTPARATRPAAPAQAASPTRVSQVQQMLNRGRASRPTSG